MSSSRDSQQKDTNATQGKAFSSNFPSFPTVSIPPGHFLLLSSLPFCLGAYRGYQKPLEEIVQDVLRVRTGGRVKITDMKTAEQDIRRAVGSAVASRALKVATLGSIGIFGLAGAFAFYITGYQTTNEAIESTRQWAHVRRRHLDSFFGITERIDRHHPEYVATKGMTEDEEMEYISKKYLPQEDWTSDNEDKQSS